MSSYKRWLHLFFALVLMSVAFGARQPVAHGQTYSTIFTVTTTNHLTSSNLSCVSPCSLFQAIRAANDLGAQTPILIQFNIQANNTTGGPGYNYDPINNVATWTITSTLNFPLPPLARNDITIDGTTQATYLGFNANPRGPEIFIDAINVTNPTNNGGITIGPSATNCTVKGLGVINASNGSAGVLVRGNNNFVQGNYIGLNRLGTGANPNSGPGVWVRGNGNTVGGNGLLDVEYNVLSGNKADGVFVEGTGNKIWGNLIGTSKDGNVAVPNAGHGVNIFNNDNIVGPAPGGLDNTYRNVIAGNVKFGVFIEDSLNVGVYANRIGINAFTNGYLANGTGGAGGGVQIKSNSNTPSKATIGGAGNLRNLIAGNQGPGIHITGEGANGSIVANNYIGLTLDGNPIPPGSKSQTVGVLVDFGANGNQIGGDTGEGNVISAINGDAIRIVGNTLSDLFSNDNHILGNYIGTTVGGTGSIPNAGNGVYLGESASFTTIGGDTDAQRNVIANNALNGVYIASSTVTTTTLGLNKVLANGAYGVRIDGARYTSMRGTDVRYNGLAGVRVANAFVTTIAGISADKHVSITGNGTHGIETTQSVSTTVQYVSTAPESSSLPKNGRDGVNVIGALGLNILSSNLDDNLGAGTAITDVNKLRIEGAGDSERTTLTRNGKEGAALTNVVSGTFQFNQVFNNKADGVRVGGATDDVSVFRSLMRFNGPQNDGTANAPTGTFATYCTGDARTLAGQGISIRDSAKQVKIIRTLFGQNCGLGILRQPNGTDPSTPNQGIQPPIFTSFNQNRVLTGRILVAGPGKCEGCTVELFRTDPALTIPDGEGFRKLNTAEDQIKTFDEKGNFSFTFNELPPQVLGTATDRFGNTSEFGVYTVTRGIDIEPPRTYFNAIPTQVITYYHTVTNTGTLDDSFRLTFASEKGLTANEVKLLPSSTFSVPAGKTVPVTVTLILPKGTDPRVRAGTIERTRITVASASLATVTDSVTDTTTITKSVVISVTPTSLNGEIPAGQTQLYAHTITNNGNITATVNLAASTNPTWATTISTTTLTLVPGQSKGVTINVTAPAGSQAGAQAVTIMNVTVPAYPTQNKVVTDTTKVVVTPRAVFYPDHTGDSGANQIITYLHTVENRSNGQARFKLSASSSLGSGITFVSTTPNITIDAQGNFTLGTTTGQDILNLAARVAIPSNAPRGGVDTVTIQLIDTSTNTVIGSVQDKTTILAGIGGSLRVYLPIIRKP